MVIHLIAKKMGVQWTKINGYGEMRFKQNYPEAFLHQSMPNGNCSAKHKNV